MSNTSCIFCNSSITEKFLECSDYISYDNFSYYRCKNCYGIYIHPIPKNIDKYYFKNYRKYNSLFQKLISYMNYLKVNKSKRFFHSQNEKKTVLEIGFGNANLIQNLDSEYKKFGVERKDFIKNNKNSIKNFDEVFTSLSELRGKYDVIFMINSLEHLSNPKQFFDILLNNLNHNGVCIITIQNIQSLQSVISRHLWFHLDPPRHITQYTKDFFVKFADDNNLKIISVNNDSFLYEFVGWVVSLSNILGFKYNLLWLYIQNIKKKDFFFFIYFIFLIPIFPISFIASLISIFISRSSILRVIIKK